MALLIPIAAKESTAAKLMDMSVAEFRAAVSVGDLPDGTEIAGRKRWDTSLLQKIAQGNLIEGWDDIKW